MFPNIPSFVTVHRHVWLARSHAGNDSHERSPISVHNRHFSEQVTTVSSFCDLIAIKMSSIHGCLVKDQRAMSRDATIHCPPRHRDTCVPWIPRGSKMEIDSD